MAGYLIFGASGGVGSLLTQKLAEHSHSVVAVGRDISRLQQLQSASVALFEGDASNSESVAESFAYATEHLPSFNGVVNCVGSIHLKPAHLTKDEEWFDTLNTNLTSAFFVLREAAKQMKDGGSVLLYSTAAARIGLPNHEAIAAAKGGIDGMVRSAAAGYASRGLRVNAIAPGLVETPLTARITSNENARKTSESMHALGRIGKPEDIVAMSQFLLSPENDWITGQTLYVDGGLSCLRAR